MTVRVLLADDHPVFLAGLRMLLDTVEGIDVVGTADDGQALLDLAAEVGADVAVVDLDMPVVDGSSVVAELRARDSGVRVLVLTMHDEPEVVLRAMRAGAHGYLLKGAAPDEIARAIRAVADGHTVLAGPVGDQILQAAVRPPGHGPIPELTPREREILDLVARGLTNPQIARQLFLSVKTVQNAMSSLFAKLGVTHRGAAIVVAREAGLGG